MLSGLWTIRSGLYVRGRMSEPLKRQTHWGQMPEMPWRKDEEEIVDTKICSKCGESKPLAEFYAMGGKRKTLRSDCKECVGKRNKQYYTENRQYFLDYRKACYKRSPEMHKERERQRYRRLRDAAIEAYGGKCACCGEAEPLFLEIDHIDNDGNEHRKRIGRSAKALVTWLRDNEYPNGFQILCANCNQAKKRNNGICPHKTKPKFSYVTGV